ncbi:unnamed protein product [Sympodiomycopsis kandeliae]
MSAVASIASKGETKAAWWQEFIHGRQEVAHVYHATRGSEQIREFSTSREVAQSEAAPEDHDLGSARNAVVLCGSAHRAFDQKRAFLLPFPNAGFKGDGTPRPFQEQFGGPQPWQETRQGMAFKRLAAPESVKWVACDSDAYAKLLDWQATTFSLELAKAEDEVDADIIRHCGPAASHIGYAAAVRFWGRPNVLHAEIFELVRRLTIAHFPEEDDLRSGQDVLNAAAAKGSVAPSEVESDEEGYLFEEDHQDVAFEQALSTAWSPCLSNRLEDNARNCSASVEIWMDGF